MALSQAQIDVKNAIVKYGKANGFSEEQAQYAVNVAYVESSLGQTLENSITTASGVFQYTNDTWDDRHSSLGVKDNQENQIAAFYGDIDTFDDRYDNLSEDVRGDLTVEEYSYVKHHDGSSYKDIQKGPGLKIYSKVIDEEAKEILAVDFSKNLFSFTVNTKEETLQFTVASFFSEHHALSEDYCFHITVQTEENIKIATLVGKQATLTLQKEELPIHGVVKSISYHGLVSKEIHQYLIELVSPLYLLKHNINSRVFLTKNVVEIITEVLGDTLFEEDIKATYEPAEFTLQYNESDYDFITRLMAKHGLYFRFDQQEQEATLVLLNGEAPHPPLSCGELPFHKNSGSTRDYETAFSLQPKATMITETVEVADYNHRTPKASITSYAARRNGPAGTGRAYCFGENVKNISASDDTALIRNQAHDAKRLIVEAQTDCPSATPGYLITISEEDGSSTEYLITKVRHEGDQSHGIGQGNSQSGLSYKNTLTLIPGTVPYRTPIGVTKKILGTFTAFVESTGKYAYLDEQGKYHIRLDLDNSNPAHPENNGSHPVRMVQPYVGKNYGFHFPLHDKTEVVLSCVNGDIDRPVILGVLPNPDNQSPVTSKNKYKNIIRTMGNNELVMDDLKKYESIDLFTGEEKNILSLDANTRGNKVRLETTEGKMETTAAKTIYLESKETHTMEGGNDHQITVENSQRLMTKKADINLVAGTDIRLKAAKNVLAHAEEEDITLNSGGDMVLDVGKAMALEIQNKDLSIEVSGGEFSISAATNINILGSGEGDITISQGGGSIEIGASGDITIEATTCNIDGGSAGQVSSTSNQGS